jgi:hypothetical protein
MLHDPVPSSGEELIPELLDEPRRTSRASSIWSSVAAMPAVKSRGHQCHDGHQFRPHCVTAFVAARRHSSAWSIGQNYVIASDENDLMLRFR